MSNVRSFLGESAYEYSTVPLHVRLTAREAPINGLVLASSKAVLATEEPKQSSLRWSIPIGGSVRALPMPRRRPTYHAHPLLA